MVRAVSTLVDRGKITTLDGCFKLSLQFLSVDVLLMFVLSEKPTNSFKICPLALLPEDSNCFQNLADEFILLR